MQGAHSTITVWNKWRNPKTRNDEWLRHIIPGCHWTGRLAVTIENGGAATANTIRVSIAENGFYRPYHEWAALDANGKQNHFTLHAGDLAAKGEHQHEITSTSPCTEAEVKTLLQPDVFVVSTVDDGPAELHKLGRHYVITGV